MLGCNRSERKRNIIVFDHQQWHAHIQAIHIHTIAYTHIHEQIIEGVEDNNNFTINGIGEVWFKQMWTPNTYTNTISHPKKKQQQHTNVRVQRNGYVSGRFIVSYRKSFSYEVFFEKSYSDGRKKKCSRMHSSHDFLLSSTGLRRNRCREKVFAFSILLSV